MSALIWRVDGVTMPGRERPRLEGVSCEIHTGVTAIVGYSGAGKTSLLNLLVGFEQPAEGHLERREDVLSQRLPLFWVPQEDGLWPHLTALEHLQVVKTDNADSPNPAKELLRQFDLLDKSEAHPDLMSQGERARLSVARALAAEAAVLVMDEPLVHVDPARSGKYWRVLRESCTQTETSLVIATHSAETVLREAERVVCLKDGRVLYCGGVEELYRDPRTLELAEFLGAANWLPSDDVKNWLSGTTTEKQCYRPEELEVVVADDGPLVVETARFAGSVEEVELVNESTDERRTFYHRPKAAALRAGMRVAVKLCTLFIFCLLTLGCDETPEPELVVRSVSYWITPPMGKLIPRPRGLTIGPNDEVLCLDNGGRVLVLDAAGKMLRQWEMPDHSIGKPEGVCVFRDGRIAVADTHYHRVVFFDDNGAVLEFLGGEGTGPGQFLFPVAICQDASEHFYVCEYGGDHRVQKFTREGKHVLTFGTFGTEPGQFQRPSGIVWHNGRLYIADAINNRVQAFSDDGKFLEVLGENGEGLSLEYPYDIALDREAEQLFVVEYGAGRVTKIDLAGHVLGRFGHTSRGEGGFLKPWGLAIDSQQRLRIADTENHRIVELKL